MLTAAVDAVVWVAVESLCAADLSWGVGAGAFFPVFARSLS